MWTCTVGELMWMAAVGVENFEDSYNLLDSLHKQRELHMYIHIHTYVYMNVQL